MILDRFGVLGDGRLHVLLDLLLQFLLHGLVVLAVLPAMGAVDDYKRNHLNLVVFHYLGVVNRHY